MIDLLPVPQDRFVCPCGQAELAVHGFTMTGMFVFAQTSCGQCGRKFLSRLHVDFAASVEFHCNIASGEIHSKAPGWYHGQLTNTINSRGRQAPPREKLKRRPLGRDVIVVNALDMIYGHCLHKLFSYSASKALPGVSFLAVVPHFIKWLVPESFDEVSGVKEPRNNMTLWNPQIVQDMAQLAANCDRLRYQDLSWSHKVNIEDYTKVVPRKAGIAPARLLINWRDDRCWTLHGRQLSRQDAAADQLRLRPTRWAATGWCPIRRRFPTSPGWPSCRCVASSTAPWLSPRKEPHRRRRHSCCARRMTTCAFPNLQAPRAPPPFQGAGCAPPRPPSPASAGNS